jgi:DNA-binding beta-propeller fold protein YncE
MPTTTAYVEVYVADSLNNRIEVFDGNGNYLRQWSGAFNMPVGIVIDNKLSRVYVADNGNQQIKVFDLCGNLINEWGSLGSQNGQFNFPTDVAVDSADNVYVADQGNQRVQIFDKNGNYLAQWDVSMTTMGISIDKNDNVYVTSADGAEVMKFNTEGVKLTQWHIAHRTYGVANDSSGNVYVTSFDPGPGTDQEYIFDPDGNQLTTWEGVGSGPGEFLNSFAVDVGSNNVIYIVDQGNSRIQEFDTAGNYLNMWGTFGSGNGQLNRPMGIAISNATPECAVFTQTSTENVTPSLSATATATMTITSINLETVEATSTTILTPTPSFTATTTATNLPCTPVSGAGWPMTGKDAQQSCIGSAVGPTTPTIRWQANIGGMMGPIVDGLDRVFTGDGGNFYALDAFGNQLWSYNGVAMQQSQYWSGVALDTNQVFFHYHRDYPAPDYIIQAFNSQNGTPGLIGAVDSGMQEFTGPVAQNGNIYIFGKGGKSVEVDSTTGNVLWTVAKGTEGAVGPSGNIYLVDSGILYSYTPPSITANWSVSLGVNGSMDNISIDSNENICVQSAGINILLYDKNGNLKWKYVDSFYQCSDVHMALSPDGGVLFVTEGSNNNLYLNKIIPDGTFNPSLAWKTQLTGSYCGGTALSPYLVRMVVDMAGNIYVPTNGNGIYAFSTDGKLMWNMSMPDSIFGMALSHDGTLYVQGSHLYAIGGNPCSTPVNTPTKAVSPPQTNTPINTSTITASVTPSVTMTLTPTQTATLTYTTTMTFTPTMTPTCTRTATITASPTSTLTDTRTITPTATFTVTNTGTRTFTPTSTASFTPTQTAGLSLQYYSNGEPTPGDNTIYIDIKVINNTAAAVNLSNITVKYWYEKEGTADEIAECDWASVGCGNLNRTISTINQGGQNRVLTLAFTTAAGSIAVGGNTEMKLRIHKTDWSVYDETNDYSYGAQPAYINWTKITMYSNGTIIWGTEPGGMGALSVVPNFKDVPSLAGSMSDDNVYSYPNPSAGPVTIKFSVAAPTDVKVLIADITGKVVFKRTLKAAEVSKGVNSMAWNGLNENGRENANGVYLLVVQAEGSRVIKKIAIIK